MSTTPKVRRAASGKAETAAVTEAGSDIVLLLPEKIRRSPQNPRVNFDPVELDELVASIRQHGVLQNVVVRPTEVAGLYELVCGERRWRAAQIIGCALPASIRSLTDQEAFELALAENLKRQNMTALEEANAFERMATAFRLSDEQIASRAGVTVLYVRRRRVLVSLSPAAVELLSKKTLGVLAAVELARLAPQAQNKLSEAINGDEQYTPERPITRELMLHLIRQTKQERALNLAPFSPSDESLMCLPRGSVGSCHRCPKNSATQRDLFQSDEKEPAEAMCGDETCWERRAVATLDRERRHSTGSVTFITGAEAQPYFTASGLFDRGQGLVPIEAVRLPSGRLIGEKPDVLELAKELAKKAGNMTVIQNPSRLGDVRRCVDAATAKALARELEPDAAISDQERSELREAQERRAQKRMDRKVRATATEHVFDMVRNSLATVPGKGDELNGVLRALIVQNFRRTPATEDLDTTIGDERLREMSCPQLVATLVSVLLDKELDGAGKDAEPIRFLLASCGVTLSGIERRLREEEEREAARKAAKAADKKPAAEAAGKPAKSKGKDKSAPGPSAKKK